jgi:sugar transferase (PEP-CTERM/EpsH1 system associated)
MQVVYSLGAGGSERLACDLSARLDPFRVRSSVCALDVGGPLADELARAGIPFHVVGRRPGFDGRATLRLYRLFRERRVDLVQTHHLVCFLYAGLAARLAGAVLVHVEHEYFSLKQPRARRLLRVLARLGHQIVTVGEEVQDFLVSEVGLPRSRVAVIRNGVDVARYSPLKRVPRAALGFAGTDRLIGHVARLEPEKDQGTLLLAFRTLLDTHPDARLVVVGDGARRGDLRRVSTSLGIAERVDFLGPRDDVADILPHLDAFVLSSIHEGLPLALLEAMACARPVVATAVGEIPRVVQTGVTGVTVPPGDPAALAASLAAVLERPVWGAAMGQAARGLVERTFNIDRTARHYQALYDTLLGGHRRGRRAHAARAEPSGPRPATALTPAEAPPTPLRLAILTGQDSPATSRWISTLATVAEIQLVGIVFDSQPPPLRLRLRQLGWHIRREGLAYLWFQLGRHVNDAVERLAARVVSKTDVLALLRRAFPAEPFCLTHVAEHHGIPVLDVGNLNGAVATATLARLRPDLGIVLGTRLLKRSTFAVPRLGCLNLHLGKVPEYRGMPPGFWEHYDGQRTAGVTVHFIDEGLDTGDVLGEESLAIDPLDCPETLRRKLEIRGGELLARCVRDVARGRAGPPGPPPDAFGARRTRAPPGSTVSRPPPTWGCTTAVCFIWFARSAGSRV